jgi:4'-phosphopantetheinyl transferase EntD
MTDNDRIRQIAAGPIITPRRRAPLWPWAVMLAITAALATLI